jgi:hypothetical protein
MPGPAQGLSLRASASALPPPPVPVPFFHVLGFQHLAVLTYAVLAARVSRRLTRARLGSILQYKSFWQLSAPHMHGIVLPGTSAYP